MTAHPRQITLTTFHPFADGVTDDTPALRRCFARAAELGGANIVIPPGEYFVAGQVSVPLPSHSTVTAYGARFLLPAHLGDGARVTLFAGEDLVDFSWCGGEFVGHCFDHRRAGNTWEPNANTRVLVVTTSPGGITDRLTFTDIHGQRIAGAVVTVEGARDGEAEVRTYATNITVQRCRFVECGKFMWDYGLLWQILTWLEEYTPADVAMAARYMPAEYLHGVRMADGDDRVWLDNARAGITVSADAENDAAVSFGGDTLPANVTPGKKYFVVAATPEYIRIADTVGGAPLRFSGAAGVNAIAFSRLHHAYYHLYAPAGAGPGKGGLDLMACRAVHVSGCALSALGDTMHIQACRDIVFANNHITGSRMGAFFLAEYCVNATITGNTIDGTNGSRVMSVEKSCTDVTIVGNTFRNGGRGSWINQPQRFILADNIFITNTTKGERHPWRGRKSLATGDYEDWPELYFTTYEPDGRYGPVIVRNNIFVTGDGCSNTIHFHGGGHTLLVDGNVFQGPTRTVTWDEGCERPRCVNNVGVEE